MDSGFTLLMEPGKDPGMTTWGMRSVRVPAQSMPSFFSLYRNARNVMPSFFAAAVLL